MYLTYLLLAVNIGLSIWVLEKPEKKYKLMLNPHACVQNKEWYRVITHAFIHADIMHLIFNMYVLYIFGEIVETQFLALFGLKGYYYFFLLYFGGLLFSALPALVKHKENPLYNSLGASGAVSGLVFAMIALQPAHGLGLLFIPFFIPAIFFGILYLVAEYFLSKRSNSHIAHDAHIFGAIFGFIFTIAINWQEFDTFIESLQNIF